MQKLTHRRVAESVSNGVTLSASNYQMTDVSANPTTLTSGDSLTVSATFTNSTSENADVTVTALLDGIPIFDWRDSVPANLSGYTSGITHNFDTILDAVGSTGDYQLSVVATIGPDDVEVSASGATITVGESTGGGGGGGDDDEDNSGSGGDGGGGGGGGDVSDELPELPGPTIDLFGYDVPVIVLAGAGFSSFVLFLMILI